MVMNVKQFADKFPHGPQPIPAKYAGKWIAWDASHTQIVAHGTEMSRVRRDAAAAGHADPILQRSPTHRSSDVYELPIFRFCFSGSRDW